jgi:hypothetical protein
MFIRKAVVEFLELWSEAGHITTDEEEWGWWVIDWRWLAGRDEAEPSSASECALIH